MGSVFTTQTQQIEDAHENMDDSRSQSDEFSFVPIENRMTGLVEEFDEGEELGTGSTCSVRSMRQRTTGQPCAVKIMKRRHRRSAREFRREANVLINIHHDHIVGLVGLYMDHTHFYIAQELCTGGMLIDRVIGNALSERDAIEISYQILDAVKFLHDHNIVHRDIKADNIMLQDERSNRITLIDFGEAREIREGDEFIDFVGTPTYMAPEVTLQRTGVYLKKVDMWAVGVTVFVMVTGFMPFFGKNKRELLYSICQHRLTFPKDTPVNARKFIAWLLQRNVDRRPSASEAMQHEWLDLEAVSSGLAGEEAVDVASNEDMKISSEDVGMGEDSRTVSMEKKEAETMNCFQDSRV